MEILRYSCTKNVGGADIYEYSVGKPPEAGI